MLIHLQSQAGKKDLAVRVDLRLRNKRGELIYDKTDDGPLRGTLVDVTIARRGHGRLAKKYLEWKYVPDPGVQVPSATPGYARVVLGPTSGNYHMESVE